jgi:CubicO group peptidase (beta-lactamase class C family)
MLTTIENMQKIVPELMETAVILGVSVAIVQNGDIWQAQWGVSNATTERPVTAGTWFQAASLSKPVFAYATLQLALAGQLDLDKPLITYLPPEQESDELLFDHIVNNDHVQQITARHVLSHAPGFPNWASNGETLKTSFTPGTRFSYSGEGYQFLQRVVAQIVGQPAHDWIRATLLTPLGMTDASFTALKTDEQVALGHDKAGQPVDFREIAQMGAAYSLHCSAAAYAQFLLAALRPSPITNLMLTPQIQVNNSSSYDDDWPNQDAPTNPRVGWGLGFGLQTGANGRFFWHSGNNGTFKAFTAGQMESGTAVVVLSNSQTGDTLWRPILETTFGTTDWPALDWLSR